MKYTFIILITAGLFCACSSAANMEAALQEALGTNTRAIAPVFLGCRPVSSKELKFSFSQPVKVLQADFSPSLEIEAIADGDTVIFTLSAEAAAGELITADVLVEDEQKNTLNVLTTFRARNERIPSFAINEIRTETSKPKGEFVEMKVLSAGNLGALRMFAATNSMDAPTFEFPPVEVKKGEYVVIHLRTYEEGTVNETGTNLAASKGTEALATARDFWLSGSEEHLRKTDAVFFLDQDDKVLDAVIFTADPSSWGSKTYAGNIAKAAELLGGQGAWPAKSGDVPMPADAFSSANTTATRSISRDENRPDTNTAADWYITASSGATPGKANSTTRYVPK